MKRTTKRASGENSRLAQSKQARKTTGENQSDRTYIDVLIPAPMAAVLDAAARDEFIRNAVREKIARQQSAAVVGNPLDKLESAKAQADALMFLLVEFITHNEDGLTVSGQVQAGFTQLHSHVRDALEESYATAKQGIAEAKGGAR